MILAIRTDTAQAEIYLLENNTELDNITWQASRNLASELLPNIDALIKRNNKLNTNLTGIVVFTGEGSFTGLRIGTTVANTLAYSYNVPITEGEGSDWLQQGMQALQNTQVGHYVVPKYSSLPNITKPRT